MISDHVRRAVLTEMRDLAGADGAVAADVVKRMAAYAGVTDRQIRRMWIADRAQRRGLSVAGGSTSLDFGAATPGLVITEQHLNVIAAHGNLKDAWRELAATQPGFVTYSQWCRVTKQQIDAGVRAALLGPGAKAIESRRLYMQRELSGRNSLWELDAQEIPVRVIAARGQLVKPWQTSVIDTATRSLLATVITPGRPNQQDTIACLIKALLGSTSTLPDGRQVTLGGLCDRLIVDNGGEVCGGDVQAFATKHGFALQMANPYSGWEKGSIESWHRTIQMELFAAMPGFTHGPETFTRTPVWDPSKSKEAKSLLMPFELLVEQTLNWIDSYNVTRSHTSLSGKTPAQVWADDTRPVIAVRRDLVVDDMPVGPRVSYRIDKAGVRFRNTDWIAVEANPHVGEKATIRYLPQMRPEEDFIAVYLNGTLLGYATGAKRLTEHQRRTLMRERRRQYETWRAAVKSGERLRAQRADEALKTGSALGGIAGRRSNDDEAAVDTLLVTLGDITPPAETPTSGEATV